MTEKEQAILLANKVLDRPYADPDDDLALLSRQFLRSLEREEKFRHAGEYFASICKQVSKLRVSDTLAEKVMEIQARLLVDDSVGLASMLEGK